MGPGWLTTRRAHAGYASPTGIMWCGTTPEFGWPPLQRLALKTGWEWDRQSTVIWMVRGLLWQAPTEAQTQKGAGGKPAPFSLTVKPATPSQEHPSASRAAL